MKYLCIIYNEEGKLRALTPEEAARIEADCVAYEDELRRDGRLLAVEALEPPTRAATVRLEGGRISVSDGPFAETKEFVAGFYLIDAADMAEATRIAAGIPPARLGSVEVRPIRQLVASADQAAPVPL